jgi:hypothetical protein
MLMFCGVTQAVDLSLQLETGAVDMKNAEDETYVDLNLPGVHDVDFFSLAYGASVKATQWGFELSAGYRYLGSQRIQAQIIPDTDYDRCTGHPSTCPKPTQFWNSQGSVSQTFVELGYRIPWGNLALVPSAGINENIIAWHTEISDNGGPSYRVGNPPQRLAAEFGGITLQWERFGVGFYVLNTNPNRQLSLGWFPGQGKYAGYLRFTYAIVKTTL